MRVFALSDIHVDYDANAKWIGALSTADYRDDILILAGDVTHKPPLLAWCLNTLSARFRHVLFVPGNHDLWVLGDDDDSKTSLQKFREVAATAQACGVSMQPLRSGGLLIAPLLGWYDYSFGEPGEELRRLWMDYRACRWPDGYTPAEIAAYFARLNGGIARGDATTAISFSHFLPRLDLIPSFVPRKHRILDPVLGSELLEQQLRRLSPQIHIYGHSHISRSVRIDGVEYINNAFGYPQEDVISSRRLRCVHET